MNQRTLVGHPTLVCPRSPRGEDAFKGETGYTLSLTDEDDVALHFVGFRGDEYSRAKRVFGEPDYVHIGWDRRARREIAEDDLILFANGPHDQQPAERNFDDIR